MFGIKDEDRFSHVYIIGKTSTGKSTLLENMALQDLERGNGFALICVSACKFDWEPIRGLHLGQRAKVSRG